MGHGPHYSSKQLGHRAVISVHTHAQHAPISYESGRGGQTGRQSPSRSSQETEPKYLVTLTCTKVPCRRHKVGMSIAFQQHLPL